MAASRDNVVLMLPGWGETGQALPTRLEVLQAAVGQLDELGRSIEQVSPLMSWSARRWMIASTPFRMRLTSARKLLDALSRVNLDVTCWTFELNDARLEVERRLNDLEICLYTLHHLDTSPAERAQMTGTFTSSVSALVKVITKIRHLIIRRFLAAADLGETVLLQ